MVLTYLKFVSLLLVGGVLGYLIAEPSQLHIDEPFVIEKEASNCASEYIFNDLGANKEKSTPSVAELLKMPTRFDRNLNAHLLVATASEHSLNRLISDVIAEKEDVASLDILLVFFSRYVQLNPHNAVIFLTDNFSSSHSHFGLLLKEVFYEWARLDSGAAFASLQGLEGLEISEEVIEYLAVKGEFSGMPELARMINGLSEVSRYKIQLELVQQKGPALVFEELISLQNRDRTHEIAIYEAVHQWAKKAPKEALSRIMRLENSSKRRVFVYEVLRAWASVDPEAALLAALEGGDEADNRQRVVLSEAGMRKGLEAVELVERYSDRLGDRAMSSVIAGWAQSDPREAARYVETNGLVTNDDIVKYALQSYGREYPREAYEWGLRVGVTSKGMKSIVRMVASNNPLEAEQLMLELPIGQDRDQFLVSIASRKVDSNPRSALAWLEKYKGERSYKKAFSSVVRQWGYSEPARAAEELLKINDDKLHRDIAPNLVQRWYEKDPSGVADWVYLSTEGVLRDQALGALALASVKDDIDKSQEFLDSMRDLNARALIEAKIKTR